MAKSLRFLSAFSGNRSGATSIEYSVIAFVVAFALLATVPALADAVGKLFALVASAF